MKYLKYFLIVGIVFIGLSNTSENTKPSEGIYPGDLFPEIENLKDLKGTTVNLSDLKGQKVLVNFWAAYDASSRKENVLLANKISQKNYPVKMVSVSFDKSESIFEKTVVIDKTEKSLQCWAENNLQEDLTKVYRLEKGFKNFLIDENGRIVAININSDNLDQYLQEI